jgi:hypothetical protein
MGSHFINCIRGYAKCDVGTGWSPLKKLCTRSGSGGDSNHFIIIYIIKLKGVKLFFFGFEFVNGSIGLMQGKMRGD